MLLGGNSLCECFLKAGPYGGLSSEELQVKKSETISEDASLFYFILFFFSILIFGINYIIIIKILASI